MVRLNRFGQPIVPRGGAFSIENPYEHLATNPLGRPAPPLHNSNAAIAFWLANQEQQSVQHRDDSFGIEDEVSEVADEESVAEDESDVDDQTDNGDDLPADIQDQSPEPEDEVYEPRDALPAVVPQFALEFEPIPLQDDPTDEELDPAEGASVLDIDLRAVQEKVAHIRDLVTSNGEFVAFLGYRLPANYNVSDIEKLLYKAGCYPKDTHLTAEELQSEPVAAWLREFAIYLPNAPEILPTGRAPSLLGSKTAQIPTRLGYSSPSFSTFLEHHLRVLMPSDQLYPTAGDSMCELCHESYSASHPPVLISDAGPCRSHIFGYQCLRKHLSSNTSVSHKCPKCRTRWFRPRRHEMRNVLRAWTEVDHKEKEAVRREEEAFGQYRLRVRARRVLTDGVLVAWDAAGAVMVEGKKWFFKRLGYGAV
jgi:hypothetical protein